MCSAQYFGHSRAYLNFVNALDVPRFKAYFDGRTFPIAGAQGSRTVPVVKCRVEYAPNQRSGKGKGRRDPREGTIEKDQDFQKFVEKLEEGHQELPSAEAQLAARETSAPSTSSGAILIDGNAVVQKSLINATNNSASKDLAEEREVKETPLMAYLRSKREKRAARKSRTAERKSRTSKQKDLKAKKDGTTNEKQTIKKSKQREKVEESTENENVKPGRPRRRSRRHRKERESNVEAASTASVQGDKNVKVDPNSQKIDKGSNLQEKGIVNDSGGLKSKPKKGRTSRSEARGGPNKDSKAKSTAKEKIPSNNTRLARTSAPLPGISTGEPPKILKRPGQASDGASQPPQNSNSAYFPSPPGILRIPSASAPSAMGKEENLKKKDHSSNQIIEKTARNTFNSEVLSARSRSGRGNRQQKGNDGHEGLESSSSRPRERHRGRGRKTGGR